MTASQPSVRQPRFCRHCGVALPPTNPRFCIECGGSIGAAPLPQAAATPPTVRLPNAGVAQSVIGGTMRLPTSGAIPPGLWFGEQPPGPDDVVAIYAPLRAIVGGWSGLSGMGWQPDEQAPASAVGARMIFRFAARREWFPAASCGRGMRLEVQLLAQAEADEGRSRRGFRYRARHDPPMEVAAAWWVDPATGARSDRALPQIQIMAPPRVPRVSDYAEAVAAMPERDAEAWAREGQIHGQFRLLNSAQQRTPAGRGLPLAEVGTPWFPLRLLGRVNPAYRLRAFHPLICRWDAWKQLQGRMEAEARGLGLDLATDLVVEWWLDRQGHDCVVFDGAKSLYGYERVAIAFRRAQVARCIQP